MLNHHIDHTNLKPTATTSDIIRCCQEAKEHQFASVCVNPCYVGLVAEQLKGSGVHTCSVIGFPLGAQTTSAKLREAADAIGEGAEEIDMVINIGKLLEGDTIYVEQEVALLSDLCHSNGCLLKVIVETCYLGENHIAFACNMVERQGADYIKTSTGFGTRGASPEDITLFRKYLQQPTKIKASGGIRTAEEADRYISLGCDRLGTSNGVEIVRERK